MTFSQAYDYLLSFINLPRREYMAQPQQCGASLKRVEFLLDVLGNPQDTIPHVIHVAGTSGKGSVTTYMHAILHASGKKVGSTQSPAPSSVLERWRVGAQYMTEDEFLAEFVRIKPALDQYGRTSPYDMPSYFEIMEALGFVWFASRDVEWLVLETGCGGRYDSSNVVKKKDAAVITNIGLDHTDILGSTREEIAWQKAGIISLQTNVFTTEKNPALVKIIKEEARKTGSCFCAVNDETSNTDVSLNGTTFLYNNVMWRVQAPGAHQTLNAQLCITVARELGMSDTDIHTGLVDAVQTLRMEVVQQNPAIILDGAHNPDKIASTVRTIQSLPHDRLHLLIGFSENKPIPDMIDQLAALHPTSVACTRNTVNAFRKIADPVSIAAKIKTKCPNADVDIFFDPADAFEWSTSRMNADDLLLVTGSVFLSGQIRAIVLQS